MVHHVLAHTQVHVGQPHYHHLALSCGTLPTNDDKVVQPDDAGRDHQLHLEPLDIQQPAQRAHIHHTANMPVKADTHSRAAVSSSKSQLPEDRRLYVASKLK
jgi:hypothetical protein